MRAILILIIIQSALAVFGSLYYSNFGDPVYEFLTGTWFDTSDALDPCQLCWWARIMMYPILPLSILALIRKSRSILIYIMLICIPGILLEIYHYILQKPYIIGKDSIPNPFGCTAANPCAALKVDYFGIITIPFMCLIAFVIIFLLSLIGLLLTQKGKISS